MWQSNIIKPCAYLNAILYHVHYKHCRHYEYLNLNYLKIFKDII